MAASQWIDPEGTHIDVRGLPAPEPLVAILSLVQSVSEGTTVIVHHERDPRFLYSELAVLGWTAERIDAPAGEVRLKLERAAQPSRRARRGVGRVAGVLTRIKGRGGRRC